MGLKKATKKFLKKGGPKAKMQAKRRKNNHSSRTPRVEDAVPATGDEQPKDWGFESTNKDIQQHIAELEALKQSDPDFYKHLEANAPGLLDFNESEIEESVSEEPEELSQSESEEQPVTQEPSSFDVDMFETLKTKVTKEKSARALGRLLKVFRKACQVGKNVDEAEEENVIQSAALFHKVMHFCFSNMNAIFRSHLTESGVHGAKWKNIEKLARSFFGNTLYFLTSCVDTLMARFILGKLVPMTDMLASFPKLASKFVKLSMKFWSDMQDHSLRIDSFVFIQSLDSKCLKQTNFHAECLKLMYLTFLKNAKFGTGEQLQLIEFMKVSLLEMFEMDMGRTYQLAFVYVRQLALHVRNVVQSNQNKDVVLNWQFMHSVSLWASVVTRFQDADTKSLVYPIVEIISMVCEMGGEQYIPWRFLCVRQLLTISRVCKVYIPISLYLMNCFSFKVFLFDVKKNTQKPPVLQAVLKVSEGLFGSRAYQQLVLDELVLLIQDFFTLHSHSIAFPELAIPVLRVLSGFIKTSKVGLVTSRLRSLVQCLQHNSDWVAKARKDIEISASADYKSFMAGETSPLERMSKSPIAAVPKVKVQAPEPVEESSVEESSVSADAMADEPSDSEDVVDDFVLSE